VAVLAEHVPLFSFPVGVPGVLPVICKKINAAVGIGTYIPAVLGGIHAVAGTNPLPGGCLANQQRWSAGEEEENRVFHGFEVPKSVPAGVVEDFGRFFSIRSHNDEQIPSLLVLGGARLKDYCGISTNYELRITKYDGCEASPKTDGTTKEYE
jgi:hypothetical protein